MNENLPYANDLIDERINAYVDENADVLSTVVKEVVDQYYLENEEAIRTALSAYVAENLLSASTVDDGDTIYDEVIYNVASDIAGAFAGDDAKSYENLSTYEENVLTALENIVLEVLNRLDEYVVVTGESVPPETSLTEEGESAVSEEPEAAETEQVRIIPSPAFSFDNTDALANQNREDVRRAEIRRVLDSLVN